MEKDGEKDTVKKTNSQNGFSEPPPPQSETHTPNHPLRMGICLRSPESQRIKKSDMDQRTIKSSLAHGMNTNRLCKERILLAWSTTPSSHRHHWKRTLWNWHESKKRFVWNVFANKVDLSPFWAIGMEGRSLPITVWVILIRRYYQPK